MADVKISELAAKASLDGTEELPINDGGTTKKATVAAIRATTLQVATIPISDSDDPGGIFAWQNPLGVEIVVLLIYLDLTTSGDDPAFGDSVVLGSAPDATTYSDNLTGGIGIDNGGGAYFTSVLNGPGKVPAGYYVNLSTSAGSAEGIVGTAYVLYFPAG